MTRALKLVFRREPAGRAAKVSALGKQGVKALLFADDPNTVFLLIFFADFAYGVIRGKARFESCGRLKQDSGKSGANEAEKPD